MKNGRILTIALFLALFSNASAKSYKVEELLEIAEKNSANIKSAEYLAKSQKHSANQEKYWSNPTIGYEDVGGQNTYRLSQTLPFFNKLKNRYEAGDAQYQAAEAFKNNLSIQVKADVFKLIYRFYGLKKKLELAKIRKDRLDLVDNYLSSISLRSPTQKAYSQITKDRIKLVERDSIKYQNEIYQTWNAANIYLGLTEQPQEVIINWLDENNYAGRIKIISAALSNNWSLKEQRMLINKAKSELSFSEIEQMPDVNISAISQRGSNSASLNGGDSNGVGVSMAIPLINRNQEKIIAAESKIKAEQAELEFRESQLLNLINNDLNQYETSLKISQKLSPNEIDKIVKRLAVANSDFKKGVLDFIAYIELDTQEYEMIDTIIDNQIDLAQAYSSLITKVGSFEIDHKNN